MLISLALALAPLLASTQPSFNAQWELQPEGGTSSSRKPDARALLQRAQKAMGSVGLKTLRYAGTGTGALVGQAFTPGKPSPKVRYSAYARLLDLEHGGLREDQVRIRLIPQNAKGTPADGEQRSTGFVLGADAWNLLGPIPVPAPYAADERAFALWTTPHGVLQAALRNDVVLTRGKKDSFSFAEPGRFTATVHLTAAGLVQQIDARVAHPVLGDTAVVTRFSNYKAFAGVPFPTRIVQTLAGETVLDLAVTEVQPNASPGIELPAMVRGATDRVLPEKLAEGVWLLAGGAHHSVAIAMKDQALLVEAPLSEARAKAVVAEVKRLLPGQEIAQVINTHAHFDSAAGLRTLAAEGATLVVGDEALPFLKRTLANPNSIAMDALEIADKKPLLSAVSSKRVLTDGTRTIEIHEVQGSPHAKGLLMVYLPAEKLLIEADAYTPGPPDAAPPTVPQPSHVNLLVNIERLKLDVQRIVPLHGRVVPLRELAVAAGRKQ